MPDSRLPALPGSLTGATLANGDLFYTVDVSDPTDHASGTSKKITAGEMANRYATKAILNVADYGAVADVRKYADGAITTGTNIFTSATATFTAADVGKTITIAGAGAAGVMLATTIAGYTNATTVTLTANASTTVSGRLFGFGTNNTATIQAAIDAANALPTGGVVLVPPGIYGVASQLVHKRNVIVRGAGKDVSTLYQLGNAFTLLNGDGETVATGSFQGIEDITLWGPGDRQPTQDVIEGGTENRLSTVRAERVWWRNVHAIYSRQMSLTGVGTYEARAEYCTIEKGLRDGINATGSTRFTAIGNVCTELADDGIAFHISAGQPAGTIFGPQCTIVGNTFYKSSGIKVLGATNATITGNSGRFMQGYGIFLDYDAVYGEGNKDPIGVTITGNSFVDTINLGYLTAGVQLSGAAIYIATPVPQQGTSLGRTVTNGTMSVGSPNLTSATIAWTSADIGRVVSVSGAGVAGATLISRVKSITSGTIAVLDNNASTAVTGTATINTSLLAYVPAMTTPGTGTVAVKGVGTNAWNGISNAATGAYGLLVSNNTIVNTLDGKKQDGTAATVFSDYGFGQLWWKTGYVDPAFVSNVNTTNTATYFHRGIQIQDGAARDCLVVDNMIYGQDVAILFGGTSGYTGPSKIRPAARIVGNKIQRCHQGVGITYGAVTVMNVWVESNEFDLDPIFESTERTLASGQPTGTWTRATGNTAVGVMSYQSYGVYLVRNTFRNTLNMSTGDTDAVAVYDNVVFLDSTVGTPSGFPSFGGCGMSLAELAQSKVIQEISDPRAVNYGSLSSVFAETAAAMPTTGTWTRNTVVTNNSPTAIGGAAITGWLRLTNGTANVAGVDWLPLYTGTLDNNAVSSVTGYAADTYLAGSNIAFPSGTPAVGTTYRLDFHVSKTNVGTATPIITLRLGTAGTTADTARCTFTFGAGTTAADEGLFTVLATFRTVGAGTAAVLQGSAKLVSNLTTTGLSNAVKARASTSAGFDSTTAGLTIGASYNGGASASHTVSLVRAELIP